MSPYSDYLFYKVWPHCSSSKLVFSKLIDCVVLVWPDLVIFKELGYTFYNNNSPNIWCGLFLKQLFSIINCCGNVIGKYQKIWLFKISNSSHTDLGSGRLCFIHYLVKVSCGVIKVRKFLTQHKHVNIPHMFDYWAEPWVPPENTHI